MCAFIKRCLSLRCLLMLLAAAAAFMLGVALVAQYGFGLHPCELCMLQRYPYAAIIALAALGAALVKNTRILWVIAVLCLLLLVADGIIAFYHAGVELGWFHGPSACTSSAKAGETLEQMREEIMHAELVPCDQPMVHVLGISMAGWNAIGASLLSLMTLAAMLVIARRPKAGAAIQLR